MSYDNPIQMMQIFGGAFAKALAHLYLCADSSNRARALQAFPEYFAKYEQMYQEHLKQGQGNGT